MFLTTQAPLILLLGIRYRLAQKNRPEPVLVGLEATI